MDLDALKAASKNAAKKTDEQYCDEILRLTDTQIEDVLKERLKSTLDKQKLAQLFKEVNGATNKNEILLSVMTKGGEIAEAIKSVLDKL